MSPTVSTAFAVTGTLDTLSAGDLERLLDRGRATDVAVEQAVRNVIRDVRGRGDAALRELAERFDGVVLDALEVPRQRCVHALEVLEPGLRSALEQAAQAIATFHRAQLPDAIEIETAPGVRLGRRAEPLRRVGVYAPGGRAAYPSSVLMGVVPAKVAGVGEVVVCSPPGADGLPPEIVLAACALAGADRVFALGGAGAIAALALGTESVPRVDRIVGPGNAYVTEAKRQLTGSVAIDSPAGPSEVLIIADASADPVLLAAEILAQAEHDPDAASVLVATDRHVLDAAAAEVERLLADQPRADIIRASLVARGGLLLARDLAQAAGFAERYAPEHLLVMTEQPRELLPELRAAGTIFLGAASSVAFGDYITGANHVLPTAGLARAYAGLSTLDFVRWATYQEITPAAAARLAAPTATLASAEGLPAHALAARLRTAAPADKGAAAQRPPLRAAYAGIAVYDPGRTPCETDLSDNTNLFGTSRALRAAVGSVRDAALSRYPTPSATALRVALAELHGVAPENIVTGCGSDDVIDSAFRAFCDPGDAVAFPDPTFGIVSTFARMNAAAPRPVALRDDLSLDVPALLAERARITYICRPNNPTGTLFDAGSVAAVCRGATGFALIDEAYADFAGEDLVGTALASDRVLVLRTLSKAWGLAGLRIGYAVGPADLVAEIGKSRGPYKVGGAAEAIALDVLANDRALVADRVAQCVLNRERLRAELARRGMTGPDSAANFVLLQVPGGADEWNRLLRARGVAVRPFPALRGLGECIRVGIGPWSAMQRFLDAFDDVLNTMERRA